MCIRSRCRPPSGADRLTAGQLLDRVDTAVCALNGAESAGLDAGLSATTSPIARPLVQRIALAATKLGNDPHNQEIAQCMLMDFGTNRHPERDRLLLAAAYHTAMHRKYGDPLEPARRFGEAMGVRCNDTDQHRGTMDTTVIRFRPVMSEVESACD